MITRKSLDIADPMQPGARTAVDQDELAAGLPPPSPGHGAAPAGSLDARRSGLQCVDPLRGSHWKVRVRLMLVLNSSKARISLVRSL